MKKTLGALVLAWGGAMMILALRSYQGPTEAHVRREKWVQLIGGVLVAAGFVIMNFIVDLLYAVLDPRIRHGHA